MTLPEQMRARADRAAPELAKMLRAGADAMEDRSKLQSFLASFVAMVQHAIGEGRDVFIEPDTGRKLSDAKALLAKAADEYDFNARYDAAWPPEVTK
jgi:hypothetical protein